MPDTYTSNHGAILLALKDLALELQPQELSEDEVQIRNDWLFNDGQPMLGLTIYPLSEQYGEGVNSSQDVGYLCGLVFAYKFDQDAILYSDRLMAWRELLRRKLTDQRLGVTMANDTAPREHVCILVRSGEGLTNPSKYPGWNITRIVVAVWLREINPN